MVLILIVGIVYGLMIKHERPQDVILLVTTFAQLIGLCISVVFIKLLGLDILESLQLLFTLFLSLMLNIYNIL